MLAPLAFLPWAVRLVRTVSIRSDGPTLNAALTGTARLGLVYSLLFSLGWLLP